MNDTDRRNRYLHRTRGQWQVHCERYGLGPDAIPPYPSAPAQPLSDIIPAALESLHLKEAADLRAVQNAWPDIAGAPLCRLTEPIKLEKGTLTLRLDHPMLLMELRGPLQQELLRRLQSRFGPKAVTTLRLHVG